MKKVLLCATVAYHFSTFHLPFMAWLQRSGFEVHVAAGGEEKLPFTDKQFQISINRNPFNKDNLQAFKELKALMEKNDYDIIHCHTPVGGVLTRLAAKQVSRKSKIYYTAHGFHFCKGAPLKQWMLYYPVERLCARWTDVLVTINEEDYRRAVKHKFPAREIVHIHGVGVPPALPVKEKNTVRESLNINKEDTVLCYGAEFNKNKNQELLLRMLQRVHKEHSNVHLLLAGLGDAQKMQQLAAELSIEAKVHFLGYRNDMQAVYRASDIAVASSKREGLPVNVMEAMAAKLPVVATINRGHRELLQGAGLLVQTEDVEAFASSVKRLITYPEEREELGMRGYYRIMDRYSQDVVMKQMRNLYVSKEVMA